MYQSNNRRKQAIIETGEIFLDQYWCDYYD
jgi:hypothetical protein